MTKILKVEQLKLREAYLKTLYWFFSFPTREMGLSDLADAIKISKSTANKVVNLLIDEGFLHKEEIGRVWRIACDQSHYYNYSMKIGYNLTMLYNSKIVYAVHQFLKNPKAIILFGSYRKGDDTDQSDIDIAAEVADDEDLRIYELAMIPEFGYRKNVKVTLHVFSRNKIDLNFFANVANGIVLDGFLEVRP